MKAKNVNLNTLIYYAGEDVIYGIKPKSISLSEGKIIIDFFNYSRGKLIADPEDTKVGNYYFNFPDAKEEQKRKRKEIINNAYKRMIEGIELYNEVINKYYDKPLTSDSEVKISK